MCSHGLCTQEANSATQLDLATQVLEMFSECSCCNIVTETLFACCCFASHLQSAYAALQGMVAGGLLVYSHPSHLRTDRRHAGLPHHRCGTVCGLCRLPGGHAHSLGHQRPRQLWLLEPCRYFGLRVGVATVFVLMSCYTCSVLVHLADALPSHMLPEGSHYSASAQTMLFLLHALRCWLHT